MIHIPGALVVLCGVTISQYHYSIERSTSTTHIGIPRTTMKCERKKNVYAHIVIGIAQETGVNTKFWKVIRGSGIFVEEEPRICGAQFVNVWSFYREAAWSHFVVLLRHTHELNCGMKKKFCIILLTCSIFLGKKKGGEWHYWRPRSQLHPLTWKSIAKLHYRHHLRREECTISHRKNELRGEKLAYLVHITEK